MTARSVRQPEFAELERVRAVGDPSVRSGAGLGEELAEGNGRAGLDRIDDGLCRSAGGQGQEADDGGSHQAHWTVLSKSPFHRRGGSL